ncbi:hypothetical protein LGW36_08905, partial [Streptococcus mutans]|nr:hypothetical protein [Streptococcus mutans]
AVIFGNLLIGSFLLVLAIIVSLKTSVLGVGIVLVVMVLLLFGEIGRANFFTSSPSSPNTVTFNI